LIQKKQGLILVCGPNGSGKSTTLRSMLEEVNETRVEHIITIEDPIEFVFTNKKCVFSQRELHYDTHSFNAALKVALREDPDIVMVGEMRDQETIMAALNLCETGHLVFSTLHTNSGPQTINRLMQAFSLDQRDAVLSHLADSLLGILSQRLVAKKGGGRVAIYELMLTTSAIRNAIRKGDTPQLENTITTSAGLGMISFNQSAERLVEQGIVEQKNVEPFIRREEA
ncbi:MAG: type IV pilus twitching motility protein PilT, partial [Patescibacteria group bacterium]